MVSECLQHYNLAISFDPNFADAYINQANVMKEQGYFDAAISSYMIAAKLRPSNADIYVNIANALKDSSRVEDSIPYYEKALVCISSYLCLHFCFSVDYFCVLVKSLFLLIPFFVYFILSYPFFLWFYVCF